VADWLAGGIRNFVHGDDVFLVEVIFGHDHWHVDLVTVGSMTAILNDRKKDTIHRVRVCSAIVSKKPLYKIEYFITCAYTEIYNV
jgi:hypothetical protein